MNATKVNSSKTKSTVTKNEKPIVKNKTMSILLEEIEILQKLKEHYGKLKVKKSKLENAISQIDNFEETKKDQFEQTEISEFPFRIILQHKEEYAEEYDDVFRINQKRTVSQFSKILLEQIDSTLEGFEKDIQNLVKELA